MKEIDKYIMFLKKNKGMVIISIITLLMCYGFRIFNYYVTIDSVSMVVDYDLMYDTFLQSGRFGYALTKKIFNLDQLDSNFSLILMGFTILLYTYTFCYIFTQLDERGEKKSTHLFNIIFAAIFISAPIFAEQYNYTLQSFEIAFAMLLLALSLHYSINWFFFNKKRFFLISILLLTYSIATYQAFAALYISCAIACYLFVRESCLPKQCYYFIVKQILLLFSSLIIYYIVNYTIQNVLIGNNNYIASMVMWKTAGIKESFFKLCNFFSTTIMGNGVFYNSVYFIVFVGMIIYIISLIKTKQKALLLNIIAVLGFLISPFLLAILLGWSGPIRTQMALPFMSAFGLAFLFRFNNYKLVKIIGLLYCLTIFTQQCKETSKLFYSDYIRYQNDVRLAHSIAMDIDKATDKSNTNIPIIFVGKREASLPASCIRGEIMGYSFFEYGHNSQWGNLPYLIQFFNSLGYKYTNFKLTDITQLDYIVKEMNSWPKENSIKKLDDFVVVKLSDD